MTLTKLACPKCRRPVPEVYWRGVDRVRCPSCETEFEQIRFPAMEARRTIDTAASIQSGEANCYFHAQNRAEAACDGCGRYVCSVCRVPMGGKQLCPSCLEASGERRKLPENQRVLHGHIAIVIAILPIIIWPLTLVTAWVAIGWCIYGWKKPASITNKHGRGGRWRFIVAGLAAAIQLTVWAFVFTRLWLK
ncbi:zinc finger domain-containing protein [Oleiharenicola lentus]|uniref:zinc finger domain-containing protein n=1 Tax=Oleiharenicola lentus TaxID=2508720 RepID=UPI003F67893B